MDQKVTLNTRSERLVHSSPALAFHTFPAHCMTTRKRNHKRMKNQIFTCILSAFYAKILVILGIALPITDSLASEDYESYEGFYVYLYLGSFAFLIYTYINHMQSKSKSIWGYLFKGEEAILKDIQEKMVSIKMKKNRNISCSSFYFIIGITGFGIGSVIYSGLQFGQYFELSSEKNCDNILKALIPLARIAFSLMQILFIFSYSNLVHVQNSTITKFGLMHMIATNLCEWIYVLVQETQHDIFRSVNVKSTNTTLVFKLDQQFINSKYFQITQQFYYHKWECLDSKIIYSIVEKAEPYLAPCCVEFSFLSAVMLSLMWKNTCDNKSENGKKHQINGCRRCTAGSILRPGSYLVLESSSDNQAEIKEKQTECNVIYSRRQSQFSVDCAQAHKGLFSGILVLAMTIISLIMFFELVSQEKYKDVAILQVNVWETALFATATLAAIFCIKALRKVGFRTIKQDLQLEHLLLLVTQCGVFMYFLFQIIGSALMGLNKGKGGLIRIITPLSALIQSCCQTVLIMDARHRRCITLQEMRRKPGKQLITFLLVANTALWIVNRLKNNQAFSHPNQMDFYGILAWNIITHVTMPMVVSYRFQATICFYEIWKRVYKTRSFNSSFSN